MAEEDAMPRTTCHMSISLDGFVAGPDQSRVARLATVPTLSDRHHLEDADAEHHLPYVDVA